MNFKKALSLCLVAVLLLSTTFLFSSCKKKETTEMSADVTQLTDADDSNTNLVEESAKSNIILLTDKDGNNLSLIPVFDVTGKVIIAGLISKGTDKNKNEITDKNIIGKVVAITTDQNGAETITLKNEKTQYLKFYNNKEGLMVALESATDGKFYEVTSTKDGENIYMQLTADKNGKPIEVFIKEGKVVDKSGNTVSETSSAETTTKADEKVATDKVVTVTDYSSLADINVELTKNSTAAVGLASGSPVNVKATSKAYVKDGILYLIGNGDYYITQNKNTSTWWGKIVVKLGNKGLARVRLAGVNVRSKDSSGSAIDFIDTDSVINDTDADSEVLITYNNKSTSKNNPNAVLSFVEGTTSDLYAEGNPNTGGMGTIYSQCKLSIQGHGTANITSENKNGIQVARSLGIQNATLNIASTAGKGIRVNNLLDVEGGATIKVDSMGDSIRCGEFLMDAGKNDEKSSITLRPTSGEATTTTGDGIDADDSAIIRNGNLDIYNNCTKDKYGIKVRRVNNEEFLKIIKSEKITDISTWQKENPDSPYYKDVALNAKEYAALIKVSGVSANSATYQGIRTADGYDDTFRITGGTVLAEIKNGRNSTVLTSKNSQVSINAKATVSRIIDIGSKKSSETAFALLYSSSDLSKDTKVTFEKAGKRNPEQIVTPTFSGNAGYATDA